MRKSKRIAITKKMLKVIEEVWHLKVEGMSMHEDHDWFVCNDDGCLVFAKVILVYAGKKSGFPKEDLDREEAERTAEQWLMHNADDLPDYADIRFDLIKAILTKDDKLFIRRETNVLQHKEKES